LEPRAAKGKEQWEGLVKKLEAADELLQKAKKGYDGARKQYGSADSITQVKGDLEAATRQLSEKQELEQNIAQTQEQLDEAKEQTLKLEQQHKETATVLQEAASVLEDLQERHAVNEIRRHLKKGDSCPVCEQTVLAVPERGKHVAVQQARELVEERRKAHEKCNASLLKKRALCESLPNELRILRKNLRSTETSISSAISKAERVLGKAPGKNAVTELEQLAERVSALETEYEGAAQKLKSVQDAESKAREDSKNKEHEIKLLSRQLETLEDGLARNASKLKLLDKDLSGQPELRVLTEQQKQLESAKEQQEKYETAKKREEALYSSTEQQRVAAETEVGALQRRLQELDSTITGTVSSISNLEERIRQQIPLPKGVDEIKELETRRSKLDADSNKYASTIAATEGELQMVVRGLEELANKREQVKLLKARADLYHELGVSLKADQFIRFIVEEALHRLADHGTQHLQKLSSGRYSFETETDDFLVIDHWNADDSRSVNTLSGGESFLASLSLALALADALTELSTDRAHFRLDSLFLDEGFSTLDPETLDVVVQGIEALAGGDRVVGVISHVPELAERFPVQIEVKKAVGGSTLVLNSANSGTQKQVALSGQ
jgi:exonuclease SbcC